MDTNPLDNESPEPIDRAIKAILRFPPVMRRMHREVFAKAQREVGIAIAHHHIMIMKTLQELGPLSSSDLAAMVFISNAQMTHSTEKLMWMGLIEKQQDTTDRRKVIIRLAPKGQVAIQRFDEAMFDLIRDRIADLSADDLEKLAESFDNIVEVFLS
jgi:DNA-binding MarR family transcriptional regulator